MLLRGVGGHHGCPGWQSHHRNAYGNPNDHTHIQFPVDLRHAHLDAAGQQYTDTDTHHHTHRFTQPLRNAFHPAHVDPVDHTHADNDEHPVHPADEYPYSYAYQYAAADKHKHPNAYADGYAYRYGDNCCSITFHLKPSTFNLQPSTHSP